MITSLFKDDGSLNGLFYISEWPDGDWKCFTADVNNIKKIIAGEHPHFERKKLKEDEINLLSKALNLLESNKEKASEITSKSGENLEH